MENKTHDVVVHKANIQLLAGESVRDFTRALSDAGRKHIQKAQNLPNKGTDVFMLEAFSKTAVFEVFKFGPDVQPGDRMKFFAAQYVRKANGDFEFSGSSEVRRVTRFEPAKVSVTKGVADPDGPDKVQKGLEAFDKSEGDLQVFGNERSQWQQTGKSFWNGAL